MEIFKRPKVHVLTLWPQVFGGKFMERRSKEGTGFSKPRANFDSFSESFYAVFQVSPPPLYYPPVVSSSRAANILYVPEVLTCFI